LFFDAAELATPVMADAGSVAAQVAEAAHATGVDVELVLNALGLRLDMQPNDPENRIVETGTESRKSINHSSAAL
jgi:hypothetical protein